MLLELLKIKGKHILLGDFNQYHPFWGGVIIINADNIVNNFIYAIKAVGLSLAIKVGIKTWVKGTLSNMLDLVFTFF